MKLYERPKIEKTLDRLPEMPEGVVVPDDISGLQPPTELKSTAGAYRWMRWLAAIVVLGAFGVMAAVLFTGGDNATEIAQVEVLGSDRHLATLADLSTDLTTGQVATGYMATYGTDNPAFVTAAVPVLGSDRHLATLADQVATGQYLDFPQLDAFVAPGLSAADLAASIAVAEGIPQLQASANYMATYGTDNPAFVTAPLVSAADLAASIAVAEGIPQLQASAGYMATYGTDNPAFVTAAVPVLGSDRHLATLADLSADLTTGQVATGYMATYGTDNPAFVTAAVPVLGSDRHLATLADRVATGQYLDFPQLQAFVAPGLSAADLAASIAVAEGIPQLQASADYMALYGTDNPVFVEPAPEVTMAFPTEGPGSNSLAP